MGLCVCNWIINMSSVCFLVRFVFVIRSCACDFVFVLLFLDVFLVVLVLQLV